MIDENLIASLGISDDIANSMVREALGKKDGDEEYMDSLLGQQINDLTPGKLIKGKIIGYAGDDVVVEVGLKSEGLVPKEEFEGTEIKPGEVHSFYLEELEG